MEGHSLNLLSGTGDRTSSKQAEEAALVLVSEVKHIRITCFGPIKCDRQTPYWEWLLGLSSYVREKVNRCNAWSVENQNNIYDVICDRRTVLEQCIPVEYTSVFHTMLYTSLISDFFIAGINLSFQSWSLCRYRVWKHFLCISLSIRYTEKCFEEKLYISITFTLCAVYQVFVQLIFKEKL